MTVQETIVARHLRRYYNEVMEIEELHDDGDLTTGESQRALILLDEKYAFIIVDALS